MSREARTLSVPEGVAGERIDSALTRVLGLSRTAIVKLLEDGDITTSGRAMAKSERVTSGQVIDVLMPEPLNQDPIPLTPLAGLHVVYDDEHIVVIDKPVGCAAHPSPGWMGPTVVGALMAAGYTISTSGPAERAGIVHRLDVGTSGLMIVAKTDIAYTRLKDAFRNHEVEKTYHALVQGHMDPSSGTIDAPIDRHPKEDHRFAVIAEGKESITHYEVIVGDTTYGADPVLGKSLAMSRPWLHALELRFKHPVSSEELVLNAPYAPDLQACLALLSEAVLP